MVTLTLRASPRDLLDLGTITITEETYIRGFLKKSRNSRGNVFHVLHAQ